MKPIMTLAAAVGFLAASPSLASPCSEQIAALEARLDEEAKAAISASSAGESVAGAREGQAVHAENRDVPVGAPAVPYQDAEEEAEVVQRAEEAGGAGDRIMHARATLNEAKTLDQEGNVSGCEEALAEAQRRLEPD
jgi:hypothetical protein